ncbi:HK97 gp10 family phage protein [Paenibacillus sediminis]|uniref:HK97 gp10 family phage protein n=1 Tax=Paenibacillus sediminis TaxID=664909 RepID=A0ABS4H6M6_9BACL|nr:HK97 gp10 family phage protein [Paenibacillus sediminis]MBP1938194.1 hypothetical protein [Paenibacillus sediminis]
MAEALEFDVSALLRLVDGSADVIEEAAKRGMHDALDAWKRESVDIAPLDEGTLRRSITVGEIERNGNEFTGEITANAVVQSSKGRFNYAYYIHEEDAGGKSLRAPGTEKKFLDIPAQQNGKKWLADIENEIKSELKGMGW